ncbi:MAG: bifunctional molybdenum cofactor biosynthesis protein MoaC/MoaB [Saprospiraceae bacterium]|nr:bifunctional molybdenum cofactor biosynthesis protein MoaC/MoaB [Saprospiraceae bacterium]MBP8094749.1 bifunctional molybdenum cofactor biosynthesis protein MoaC/MoaB [Saprospiraceae bacterium]
MVDITHKTFTLRKAIATAVVKVSKKETMEAIQNKTVPKGDIFEFAKVAGLFGVKKTSELIPDCHPLPIEFTQITYDVNDLEIHIFVEVHTIYKTGVEVEAMHGASIVALTMYDMLKPIDKGVEIHHIRLVSKKGGKSDINKEEYTHLRVAIIVCSDSVSKGTTEDTSGGIAKDRLEILGLTITTQETIPDDFDRIQSLAKQYSQDHDLLLFIGGTGLSPRDITPDALMPLIDREIPGVVETARQYGQQRMPTAMLSRGIAGFIGDALVVTTPGSPGGARETIDALFPAILHVFRIKEGKRH